MFSVFSNIQRAFFRCVGFIGRPRVGTAFLILVCVLFLLISMRMQWVFLPLSDGIRGGQIKIPILPLSMMTGALCFFLLGGALVKWRGIAWQWLLFIPFLIAFCWPFSGSEQLGEHVPKYFQESRDRAILTELFRSQEIGNINLQPKYQPYFDVQNNWQQLQVSYQILDIGWYLYVILALIVPFLICRLLVKKSYSKQALLAVSLVCLANFLLHVQKDPFYFSASLNDAEGYPTLMEECNHRLLAQPGLAQSDYFINRCAEAYSMFMHWRGPVAYIPNLYSQFGGRSFLRLATERLAEFQFQLNALRQMQANSPLEQAFVKFAERHYQSLLAMHAIELVGQDDFTKASSLINELPEPTVATNVLVGFIATRMGQAELSVLAYDEAIAQIGNTSMQANSYCSLGDALVTAGEMTAAREYFQLCRELDGELNYWAISGLGG